jgi:hypothetical protein
VGASFEPLGVRQVLRAQNEYLDPFLSSLNILISLLKSTTWSTCTVHPEDELYMT